MRILVIVAHPDDECMFFYPSISGLQKAGHEVYLLCLCKGNYYGLGELRACELYHSCSLLGIQQTHVTVVEDAELQDGLGNLWNRHTVSKYVSSSVMNIDAEVLITFDAHGVSGHPNHSSAWAGVISAWENLSSNREIALYNLKSSNILVKYSGILSFLTEPIFHFLQSLVTKPEPSMTYWNINVRPVWRAMLCHESQMTWYRRLFILLSQYSFNNRLIQISPQFKYNSFLLK